MDNLIKIKIVDSLLQDTRVDSSNIELDVKDRNVVLNGKVPNRVSMRAAIENVWKVNDVLSLKNNLKIDWPSSITFPSDEDVVKTALKIIEYHPELNLEKIDIKVENLRLTIKGTVDAYWKKIEMEDVLFSISGLRKIVNELVIVPSEIFLDEEVAREITGAIERSSSAELHTIDIKVENGIVYIAGYVENYQAYNAILSILYCTLGVVYIYDELTIK